MSSSSWFIRYADGIVIIAKNEEPKKIHKRTDKDSERKWC